ncbi:MAG: stage II sporulation protein R [Lachnospiraceae bacterium]|nr:stage II sporulation protein R [Lachnospiraceae bacterium]
MRNTIIDNLKKLEQRCLCSMKASVPRMRSAGLLAGVLAFVWWCVLYPELCFPQDTYEAVYEAGGKETEAAEEGREKADAEKEGAEQEKSALAEENCCWLLRADKEQVIVKSRLLEWLEQHIE